MILDVLFIFVKQNPDVGGYRQGMHELLAPLVYVLNEDAIEGTTDASAVPGDADAGADAEMRSMLNSSFIEHDAYALFSKIMSRAKSFYETSSAPASTGSHPSTTVDTLVATDPSLPVSISELLPAMSPSLVPAIASGGPATAAIEESTIVELSKEIHEGSLMKVDPELALHLKNIEVLPQIFLIRWIRLLFGREFPFDQHLVLWDGMFAFDPKLNLVPLICVAMLLRIRWQREFIPSSIFEMTMLTIIVIDADYSVALQLLLKYQTPQPPYGPHTFVDDAVFLRDHLDTAGGAELILKYTDRPPARFLSPLSASTSSTRPSTPAAAFAAGLGSLRSRTLNMARSPLRASRPGPGSGDSPTGGHGDTNASGHASSNTALSPSRFIQRREGVEALFQGARNVFERGEKLGINQAVRDAMGEIKRNVAQGLQEAKQAAAQRNTPVRVHGQASGFPSPLPGSAADSSSKRRLSYGETVQTLADMEQRNRQLASMLDETIVALKAVARSVAEKPPPKDTDQRDGAHQGTELQQAKQQQWLEEVEIAAAKVQFVKVYLEDPSLVLPDSEPEAEATSASKEAPAEVPIDGQDGQDSQNSQNTLVTTAEAETLPSDGSGDVADLLPPAEVARVSSKETVAAPAPLPKTPLLQTGVTDTNVSSMPPLADSGSSKEEDGNAVSADVDAPKTTAPTKPVINLPAETKPEVHTVPARSSLAQSSFAWMLEPGDTPASVSNSASNAAVASSHATQSASGLSKKSGPSRPRHAFLFGDSASQLPPGDSSDPLADTTGPTDPSRPPVNRANSEVFGLEPLRPVLPREQP